MVRNLEGLPLSDVWYPTALAQQILGYRWINEDGTPHVYDGFVCTGQCVPCETCEEDRRLMQPASGAGETTHHIDPLLLAMMQDIGWVIKAACLQ